MIFVNQTLYSTNYICQSGDIRPRECIGYYDYIIAAGLSSWFTYGHWILDILAPIALLPLELRSHFFICIGRKFAFHSQFLPILGINESNIIEIGSTQFALGKHVYQFVPCACNSFHMLAYYELRKLMLKYFNLIDAYKSKPAYRYAFLNRYSNQGRHVNNPNEALEVLKEECPGPWEILFPSDNLKETALTFNSIKIVFAVSGSENTNALFMQPETIYCEITTKIHFPWCAFHITVSHTYYLTYNDDNIAHFGGSANLNLDIVRKLIKAGYQKLNSIRK